MGTFNTKIETGEGQGSYIKFKDGDALKGVLAGETKEFYVQWNNGKPTVCDKDSENAKFRFKTNFVVTENGAHTAKVLEQGPMLYKAFQEMEETGYDLAKTMIIIKRKGSSATDTEYSAIPAPGGDLTEMDLTNLKKVDLLDL